MSNVSRRVLTVAVVVLAGGTLVYPREVQIAPEWAIRVVDARGTPVPGARVTEDWAHYDIARGSNVEHRITDGSGLVVFPARTIRVSWGTQLVGRIRVSRLRSAEVGTGTFAAAAVHYPDDGRGEVYPVSLPGSDAHRATSEVRVGDK